MPLYDFQCPNCGTFEARARVGEKQIDCPKCGLIAARKYSSTYNIHYVPGYNEALEETQDLMDKGKI